MADIMKSTSKSINLNTFNCEKSGDMKNGKSHCPNFRIFDLAVLIFSFISVISDLCTDFILVVQYSYQGYKAWATATFILIFFPSLAVQFFSIRWHVSDKSANIYHWLFHCFMLGIIQRYISIIKSGYKAYKSKDSFEIQKVYLDQSDLCMLHLFESFLESSPQLVLQVYVIVKLNEWRFWTVFSALASLVSLSWALAAYSKTQRQARPNKNCSTWIGLLFQAFWSAGMLLARIMTLVLGVYCFGSYVFLFITIHWLSMTIWIITQKTDFCESYWEEKIYNAVVGIIYCFCFFNLQEGHSRWRLLTFHVIIIFENLSCLTIFLILFGKSSPNFAIFSFMAIVGGMLVGISCMLMYYRFYHPSGPIKFSFILIEEFSKPSVSEDYCSMTLRSLKQMRSEISSKSPSNIKDTSAGELPSPKPTDSIIIIEENEDDSDDTDIDIKTLRDWINYVDDKPKPTEINICQRSVNDVDNNDNAVNRATNVDNAFKRRAICSTSQLEKLSEFSSSDDGAGLSEISHDTSTPSEGFPTHDYENMCFVNIAREKRCLRSWEGYSDIHAKVLDRDMGNPMMSSTMSDGSSIATSIGTESMQIDQTDRNMSEDPTDLEKLEKHPSVDSLTVTFSPSLLDTILEESDDLNDTMQSLNEKQEEKTLCTLVATIDKIRLNTPICNRFPLSQRAKIHSFAKPIRKKLITN